MAFLDKVDGSELRTVSLKSSASGLTARERFERFKLEAMTEVVLRLAGGLMVLASVMLWFLLPFDKGPEQIMSYSALASICAAGGLVVFAYGTRGFRRQLKLDTRDGTLSLTKININEQARVARLIDLEDIESVFLRRPQARGGFATLYVRVKGSSSPAIGLSGAMDELEQVHRELCDIIRATAGSQGPAAANFSRAPRPRLFAQT